MNSQTYTLIMLVALVAIMYFLMIRPQRKRDKETQEMRNSLKKGDKVVTIGGIIGTIASVNEETVVLLVGKDRTKLEFLKSAISSVRSQGPASAKAEKEEEKKEEAAPVNRDKKISPKKLSAKKPVETVEEKVAEAKETLEAVEEIEKAADETTTE